MITPYNAALAYRGAKRLRTAYAVGSYAWRHRRNIVRGARTIQRAYRRYRRYKRKRGYKPSKSYIGERVGTSSAKFSYTYKTLALNDTKTLYAEKVNALNRSASDNHISQPQRDIINMRGFKICFMARNERLTPMFFNMAVLIPKQNNTIDQLNFFRNSSLQSLASANSRYTAFDASLTGMELHCNPINTDAYVVLRHWRRLIGPKPGDSTATYNTYSAKNWFTLDKYVKIKRQIRYNASGTDPINGDVWLCWWWSPFLSPTSEAPIVGAVTKELHTVMYWREPRS